MPGTAVPLGPFKGGMNNRSEPGTVSDDELPLVENMEFDLDGTLVSRPAITLESSGQTGDMQPLGYYVNAAGETFLVVSTSSNTRIYNLATQAWTTIWSGIAADFVQYDNKIVMISEGAAGGYWENGTFTATASMPRGSQIVLYKERFWARGRNKSADATTVWFSNLTVINPAQSIFDWVPASNFFTVAMRDGKEITSMVADVNALIIFKQGSTYTFDYPSAPRQGTLRQISTTLGAENKWCVVPYENYFLVLWGGVLYQFMQQRFYPLNLKKIAFEPKLLPGGSHLGVRVSVFANRVMVWFYGTLYVYNLVTSTWATWDSPTTRAAQFFTRPPITEDGERAVALAITGENVAGRKRLWRIEDRTLNSGDGEVFNWRIRTKAYVFGEEAKHKRLLFWTVGIRSASGVDAIANPIGLTESSVTWDDLDNATWDRMNEGTWNSPLVIAPKYEDNVDYPSQAPIRMLVKVKSAFRALGISFEVFGECDGTARTSPARIYSVVPYLLIKADVSKKVS